MNPLTGTAVSPTARNSSAFFPRPKLKLSGACWRATRLSWKDSWKHLT